MASESTATTPKELYALGKGGDWTTVLETLASLPRSEAARAARYTKPSSGWGLLHQAAWWGHQDAVRVLVGLGAHVTDPNVSPAEVATQQGFSKLATFLDSIATTGLWEWPPSPADLDDTSLFPSSCDTQNATATVATSSFSVAYGGGKANVREGATVWLDPCGRVCVGWHGTVSPPSGMSGESLVSRR